MLFTVLFSFKSMILWIFEIYMGKVFPLSYMSSLTAKRGIKNNCFCKEKKMKWTCEGYKVLSFLYMNSLDVNMDGTKSFIYLKNNW